MARCYCARHAHAVSLEALRRVGGMAPALFITTGFRRLGMQFHWGTCVSTQTPHPSRWTHHTARNHTAMVPHDSAEALAVLARAPGAANQSRPTTTYGVVDVSTSDAKCWCVNKQMDGARALATYARTQGNSMLSAKFTQLHEQKNKGDLPPSGPSICLRPERCATITDQSCPLNGAGVFRRL